MKESIQFLLKGLSEEERVYLARLVIKEFGISDACHEGACPHCRQNTCMCICHV